MEDILESENKTDYPVVRYLQVNSCGSERVTKHDYTILRSKGRKDYHLLYVQSGRIDAEIGETKVSLTVGQCIVFLPGIRQCYTFAARNDPISYYVHFNGTAARELFSCVEPSENMVYDIVDRTAFEGLFHHLIYIHNASARAGVPQENGVLLQLISLLARSSDTSARPGKKDIFYAAAYIREHFHEPLNLKICADELHLSVSRFSHLFTETMGVSPHKFLIRFRMDKAKELLLYSSMSIGEVSENVGFADPLYFSRLFRRYAGCSPKSYRKLAPGISR